MRVFKAEILANSEQLLRVERKKKEVERTRMPVGWVGIKGRTKKY